MFDIMKVAKNIKAARIAQNMTQMNLADAMEVSYQAVSNWERGNSMPDIAKLEQLCQILKISLDKLLGTEEEAKTIAKIINGNGISLSDITIDVIKNLAPLLSPQKVKELLNLNHQSKQENNSQTEKDSENKSENKKEWKIDYYTIMGLAPFLTQEDLDALVTQVEGEISPEALIALAPFLNRDCMDALAMRLTGNISLEILIGLMPFLSKDGQHKLWKKFGLGC